MWKQLKFGVWSANLSHPVPSWWLGWSSAGNKTPLGNLLKRQPRLQIQRQEHDGWVDFFLGEAQTCDRQRFSLLDAKAKVALHYLILDLDQIRGMRCPSQEIPQHLWQQLQKGRHLARRRF